jgi:hypothetical protein
LSLGLWSTQKVVCGGGVLHDVLHPRIFAKVPSCIFLQNPFLMLCRSHGWQSVIGSRWSAWCVHELCMVSDMLGYLVCASFVVNTKLCTDAGAGNRAPNRLTYQFVNREPSPEPIGEPTPEPFFYFPEIMRFGHVCIRMCNLDIESPVAQMPAFRSHSL